MKDHVERLARARVQMMKERPLVEARVQELLDEEADAEVPAPAPAPSRLSALVELLEDIAQESFNSDQQLFDVSFEVTFSHNRISSPVRGCPPIGKMVCSGSAGPGVVCPAGAGCPDPIGGLRHFSEEAGA